MPKTRERHITQAVLKKLANVSKQPGVVETLVGLKLKEPVSRESVMEELFRWFLRLRAALREPGTRHAVPIPEVIEALGEIARKHGIPPARFYPALLEKMLAEPQHEETGRLCAKLSTRDRIFEAALEIFSVKGFHTATTDEIAERAGVGKGTLYRHFETKEKLFGELVRVRLDELESKAASIMDGRDDVLTMISKYIGMYFEFFDRNKHLYRLIVQEHLDLGEHSPDNYFKKVMRAVPNLKRKVYESAQQGKLKDVDFQTVFYGTMGFVHGVIQKWLARDCSYPLVEEIPGVLEVLFYGFVKKAARVEFEN